MTKIGGGILTMNGGSSSIKFAVFTINATLVKIWEGSIERIGMPEARFRVKGLVEADGFVRSVTAPDHASAVKILMDWNLEARVQEKLVAVAHRIVHGGPKYSQPQRITGEMLNELRRLIPFDPEHLPQEILIVEAIEKRFPNLIQIACFDTDFHCNLPRVARLLPIPRRYEAQGLKRYGFHGLSYAYLMDELARLAGAQAAKGRIILAHLGNGASLAAVHDGKPVDTSMGFTPASGLVMGSRSGDLDPGVFSFLTRTEGMTEVQFQRMVNHESGMLGISETSSDMQYLLGIESEDIRAAEAIELFVYQIRKAIGAFAAALGGLDTLVFTGGIGENASLVRARICKGLGFLGIQIDEKRNEVNAEVISTDSCKVSVRVIPTDEELRMAHLVLHVLGN